MPEAGGQVEERENSMKKYNRIFVIVLDSLGIGVTVAENFDVKMPEGTIGHSILKRLG